MKDIRGINNKGFLYLDDIVKKPGDKLYLKKKISIYEDITVEKVEKIIITDEYAGLGWVEEYGEKVEEFGEFNVWKLRVEVKTNLRKFEFFVTVGYSNFGNTLSKLKVNERYRRVIDIEEVEDISRIDSNLVIMESLPELDVDYTIEKYIKYIERPTNREKLLNMYKMIAEKEFTLDKLDNDDIVFSSYKSFSLDSYLYRENVICSFYPTAVNNDICNRLREERFNVWGFNFLFENEKCIIKALIEKNSDILKDCGYINSVELFDGTLPRLYDIQLRENEKGRRSFYVKIPKNAKLKYDIGYIERAINGENEEVEKIMIKCIRRYESTDETKKYYNYIVDVIFKIYGDENIYSYRDVYKDVAENQNVYIKYLEKAELNNGIYIEKIK